MPSRKQHKVPEVGSTFERIYKRKNYRMKVVSRPNGVAYEVEGQVFKTPSGAAKSIINGAVNGWVFWNMDQE
jgi:hypothetical protein